MWTLLIYLKYSLIACNSVAPANKFRSFEHHGRCYMVSKHPRNWEDARNTCKSIGRNYDITSITSAVEHRFLSSTLYGVDHQWRSCWIGLQGMEWKRNMSWSDGLPLSFGSDYDKYPWDYDPSLRPDNNVSSAEVI